MIFLIAVLVFCFSIFCVRIDYALRFYTQVAALSFATLPPVWCRPFTGGYQPAALLL